MAMRSQTISYYLGLRSLIFRYIVNSETSIYGWVQGKTIQLAEISLLLKNIKKSIIFS